MKTRPTASRRKSKPPTAFAPAPPLKRVNYFYGRMLSTADFQAEQDYLLGKQRRHNLQCHGVGIVSGLAVTIAPANGGSTVTVSPGFALDAAGNEVELRAGVGCDLPAVGKLVYVVVSYQEQLTDPVPAPGQTDTPPPDAGSFSRITEGAQVSLVPAVVPPAVALARLVGRGKGWLVDGTFKPARAH